jgi:hypothetical protein
MAPEDATAVSRTSARALQIVINGMAQGCIDGLVGGLATSLAALGGLVAILAALAALMLRGCALPGGAASTSPASAAPCVRSPPTRRPPSHGARCARRDDAELPADARRVRRLPQA